MYEIIKNQFYQINVSQIQNQNAHKAHKAQKASKSPLEQKKTPKKLP